MIDDLKQLAIFSKTVHHGSFRAAANALNLSPSVVSHHISSLEEKLGAALLYRSTRALTLTREGATLLASAETMLAAVEQGLNDVRQEANAPSGELRITLPSVLSESPLMVHIAKFMVAHPHITLSLEFTDERRHLIRDGFDMAIRMGTEFARARTRRLIGSVPCFLVASTEYLRRNPKIATPDDLRAHDWLMLAPIRMSKKILRKDGVSIPITMRKKALVSDARALYKLAKAGVGIAMAPEFLAQHDIAHGDMQQLLPDWPLDPLHMFAEWPANAPTGGLTQRLVAALSASKT